MLVQIEQRVSQPLLCAVYFTLNKDIKQMTALKTPPVNLKKTQTC